MDTGHRTKADLYDLYRWSYPRVAIDWIREAARIGKEAVICDMGAGTGKLTELLSPFVRTMYAVEPDAGMAEVLARKKLGNTVLLSKYSDSVPEIPDASVDALLVGHALHWFSYPSTLREFGRILKPGGFLVNVSNAFRESTTTNARILEAMEKYRRPVTYQNTSHAVLHDYCADYEERSFPFSLVNDMESYVGGISSASYYPDESDGEVFREMRRELAGIFGEECPSGRLEMQCSCVVQIGRLREQPGMEPS